MRFPPLVNNNRLFLSARNFEHLHRSTNLKFYFRGIFPLFLMSRVYKTLHRLTQETCHKVPIFNPIRFFISRSNIPSAGYFLSQRRLNCYPVTGVVVSWIPSGVEEVERGAQVVTRQSGAKPRIIL